MSPYIYALCGFFCFGLGSQFFTKFSRRISPIWINCFKGAFACFCFLVTVVVTGGFHAVNMAHALIFAASGFVGLGIGDFFLMKAFKEMGPGRVMIIFAIQPMITGLLSFLIFGQKIDGVKFVSIALFISCIFIFSFESYKKNGHWALLATTIALSGVVLDSCGVILTRYAFNLSSLRPVEGNFYRSLGAVAAFILVCNIVKVDFFKTLKNLKKKVTIEILIGSFIGAYLSLMFYLAAIQSGHLASLSAMSIVGVLFAAGFECLFEKKWPSKYLVAAFILFSIGMFLLLK